MFTCRHIAAFGAALAVTLTAAPGSARAQFGALLSGVGPVNRSMAGASTAAPLDTLGAFLWNPATISTLPDQVDFGLEVLIPQSTLASSVAAGSLGPGIPGADLSGATASRAGAFPLPEFGFVHRPEGSAWSYGVGVLAVAGFGANYRGDPTNPILSPNPPAGLGVGPLFSQYALLQLVPTVALQVNDELSIGFSPIVDIATCSLDPGFVAAPDAAAGGAPTYPPLTHGAYQWGGGFQLGAFWLTPSGWAFGASYKSQQWMNPFGYSSRDQLGRPTEPRFLLDAPMITSVGTSYSGFDRWLFALDLRYIDYANTPIYSGSGIAPDGAVRGLAFDSIFALAFGTQYRVSERMSLRGGYSYNTNPIRGSQAFTSIAAPLVLQHGLTCGGSYSFTDFFLASVAYGHYFENSVSGPFLGPAGPVPGTSVRSSASADSIIAGVSFLY